MAHSYKNLKSNTLNMPGFVDMLASDEIYDFDKSESFHRHVSTPTRSHTSILPSLQLSISSLNDSIQSESNKVSVYISLLTCMFECFECVCDLYFCNYIENLYKQHLCRL